MFKYDPAKISSRELPIWGRSGSWKWYPKLRTAQALCKALAKVPSDRRADFNFSAEEWENILVVANGGIWPVPEKVYDYDDWVSDASISAAAGQEISEDIYYHMFDVLPPLHLPRNERTAEYDAGFLVSEPNSADPCGNGILYAGYGQKGNHYYFIGLLPSK